MLKFKDYKYEKPDFDKLEEEFRAIFKKFNEAETLKEQNDAMKEINNLRSEIESMNELVGVRYCIDTTDEFYEKEQEYMDECMPKYEGIISEYYKNLINSKFRNDLEKQWGKHIFNIAEMNIKTFKPEIIEDLQKENKLNSEYTKLMASAKIPFEGEDRNLSQMYPFMTNKDREIRKAAGQAASKFFADNEKEFDRIYDEMVKVRDKIAKKLGFKNYVELGYLRLNRSDYNAEMVANYRKQVEEYLVPISTELLKRQAKRLGIEDFKYYDGGLKFLTGNATPKGTPEWILDEGTKMYDELSPETSEFFKFMRDKELMDLLAKKGKNGGGFCTYISKYESPFIFANFNGTAGDIDVLTHEAGHAFQVYSSRGFEIPEYWWPTLEACEIHSMSMEFLTWPWMKNFFKEDVDKYKFTHLSGALTFIPYGVTVDEFQHFVYENPEATPDERKAKWREIEKKYLPGTDYDGVEILEKGAFWFRQGHIFANPFYYIDYTLAQVCAFQFWVKSIENREEAWKDYLRLCKAGGSKSFLGLVEYANLKNPFEDGCIQEVVPQIKAWLNEVDDTKL